MPLEIKELHIKVNVNPPETGGQGASPNGTAGAANGAKESPANQEEIIAACIEQILQILQERKEA
jgi:hypothetical protein